MGYVAAFMLLIKPKLIDENENQFVKNTKSN